MIASRVPLGDASPGSEGPLHGDTAHATGVVRITNTEADQITPQLAVCDWHRMDAGFERS